MRPQGNQRKPVFYFSRRTFQVAQKRRHTASSQDSANLRAAVEATVRSVKQPFRHGKVLVRGLFRVSCLILASALMVNARRLHQLNAQNQTDSGPSAPFAAFSALFSRFLARSAAFVMLRDLCQRASGRMTNLARHLRGRSLACYPLPL